MSTKEGTRENPLPLQMGRDCKDKSTRESRIINGLLAFCLIAGFACFALIILPDQVNRARSGKIFKLPNFTPPKLSAIVPIEQPRDETKPIVEVKSVARFEPERLPPPPGGFDTEDYDEESIPDIAGGPGAAIDDFSNEAYEAEDLTYRERDEKKATVPASTENQDSELLNLDNPFSDFNAEVRVHPVSSLAMNAPSVLDSKHLSKKYKWLQTPRGLETDVAFWLDVYTKYDKNTVVLHHPQYLNIVYEVVDLNDIDKDVRLTDVERSHQREQRVKRRRERITDILKKLSTKHRASSLTQEEWHIRELFADIDEKNKFKKAAEDYGVRAQRGQGDKFITGLQFSGRYLGEIESIIEEYGLPRELTRLIFVESMFNTKARSFANAGGIWQFMPGTGRLYLRINELMDERYDPLTATHAAAMLLRHNYNALGTWPLAINAYNTGRGRMQQAVKRLGTRDIGYIIKKFQHRSYGFASRNFFLEFLAALYVAEHFDEFFGEIEFDEPLRYEVVRSTYHISLPDVARVSRIPMETLEELNPAFSARVRSGKKLLPKGFSVRVPEGRGDIFLASAARAPKSRTGPLKHVVKRRETLNSIASMYGVIQSEIRKANRNVRRRPRRGQVLVIPFD